MKTANLMQLVPIVGLLLLLTGTAQAGCYDDREPGMDWSGCKKTNKILDDSDFTGSRFDNATLARSTLNDSELHALLWCRR